MKNKILSTCAAVLLAAFSVPVLGQVQNPNWYFPPNKVTFSSSGSVAPTVASIGTGALSASGPSNGIHNRTSDVLALYMNDFTIRDKVGTETFFRSNWAENLVIPVPGVCNQYYVLSWEVIVGSSPCVPYIVQYKKITLNASGNISGYSSWQTLTNYCGKDGYNLYKKISFAASKPEKYTLSGVTKERSFLYINNVGGVSDEVISKFEVTDAGITYVENLDSYAGENSIDMDLSHDGKTLVYGTVNTGIPTVNFFDVVTKTYSKVYIPAPTGTVFGVEFSKNGDYAYAAVHGDKIYRIKMSDKTYSAVTGSTGYANSQLELAYDGYIYASNGVNIKGFDPEAASPAMTKTVNVVTPSINVYVEPNSVTVYTLPDQIDGYTYKDVASTCVPLKSYSNVQASDGTLPALVDNAVVIQTGVNTLVNATTNVTFRAGDEINLESGFDAEFNSEFLGEIVPCSGVVCTNVYTTSRIEGDIEMPGTDAGSTEMLSVFPNPSSGIFNVKMNLGDANLSSAVIMNSQGSVLQTISSEDLQKDNFTVNLENQPSGIYFIKMTVNGKTVTKKIVLE